MPFPGSLNELIPSKVNDKGNQVILEGTLTGVQGNIRCKAIEMKCILAKFPMYVTGSSLGKIVKVGNTRLRRILLVPSGFGRQQLNSETSRLGR